MATFFDLNSNVNESILEEDDTKANVDLDLIVWPLTIFQMIFIILGVILKLMIIYFEHYGRDSQKRSLVNRVSKTK